MSDTATGRVRGANASRERLLAAAGELFAARGYDKTTSREIGDRAGVDPAMIARYFGGKAQLYIAVLLAEGGPDVPPDLLQPGRLAALVRRTDDHQGPGPVFQAALKPYDDGTAQQAATDELYRRVITPLRDRLAADGAADAELRAEFLTALVIGVTVARRAGALTALTGASSEEIVRLLEQTLGVSPA